MKLKKGDQIEVYNLIMKPPFKGVNSGFLNPKVKTFSREIGTSELPGAWITTAPASALNGTICDYCRRMYNFDIPGARAQCKCKGREIVE